MEAQRGHHYRSPVPVVARIVDVLHAKRRVNSAPHMERVVALNNVFATVSEAPIPQQKARHAKREVLLMIARDAIRNKCHPGAVEFSMPRLSVRTGADLRRFVHFRKRKRFMPAFVPSPPAKHSHPPVEWLFEIHAESVLDRRLHLMSCYIPFVRFPL